MNQRLQSILKRAAWHTGVRHQPLLGQRQPSYTADSA